MLVTETHILFYGGPLSNFYWVNDDSSSTSEQKFMLLKATIFDDTEAINKIADASYPSDCKAIGRTIKNFDNEVWANHRYDCMMGALTWKYDASQEFRQALREAGDRIIVEASPYDRIWGIGYTEEEAMDNQDSWGLNLLGQCLMDLKEENEL